MRNLIRRIRLWLLRVLRGVPRYNYEWLHDEYTKQAEETIKLSKQRDELQEENTKLKQELRRRPAGPEWADPYSMKNLRVETLTPRTLQAEWRYQQNPDGAVAMDLIAKDRVTQQILDGVRQHIHFSYEHDFFGNSRVTAALRVLVGPGEVD